MATAQTIINRAMRLIGALGSGESPSTDETTDCLAALNGMVDLWQTDGLLVYAVQDVTKTLTVNDADYTIGSGANIDTTRPVEILGAFVTENNVDFPVEIIDKKRWDAIADNTVTGNIAQYLYYYPSYPSGVINLWPKPSVANVLTLSIAVPVQSFAASSTTVSLPNGYQTAMEYNLAIMIAAEFGKAVPADVARIAASSLAQIKRKNAALNPITSSLESAHGRRWDIKSDS